MSALLKRRKLLEFALGSLYRRKGRNGAVLAVFTLIVALLFSILFLVNSLKAEVGLLLESSPDLVVQRLKAGRADLAPLDWAGRIGREPGVKSARPRHWGYYYDAFTKGNYTVMDVEGAPSTLPHLSGRLPRTPEEVALGRGVAMARRVEVGDDLALIDAKAFGVVFQVVGVFEARSDLLTNDLVVMTGEGAAAFLDSPPGFATDIAVAVHNPTEVEALNRKVSKLYPDARGLSRAQMKRTYDAVFDWRSGMLLAALSGGVLAFCVLAWDKATGLSAQERREIGILKALGWDTGDVLEMKFWEGFVMVTLALLMGLLISYLHVHLFDAALFGPILMGWSVLFPALKLTPQIDYLAIARVCLLVAVPYVVGTVVPSWKAAKADPDEVMRGG